LREPPRWPPPPVRSSDTHCHLGSDCSSACRQIRCCRDKLLPKKPTAKRFGTHSCPRYGDAEGPAQHFKKATGQQTRNAKSRGLCVVLEGRSYRDKQTRADLETAVSYFRQAIAKDPGYALAYAGLADAYALLPDYGASPSEDIPKSKLPPAKHLSWTLPWPVLTSIWAAP
jgi:hypothetical protein